MKEKIREYLKENLGIDDAETFEELYENFKETLDESIEKITKSIAEENFQDLRSAAHAIKGCSANIGAAELRAVCTKLQEAAERKEHGEAVTLLAEIRRLRPLLDA